MTLAKYKNIILIFYIAEKYLYIKEKKISFMFFLHLKNSEKLMQIKKTTKKL